MTNKNKQDSSSTKSNQDNRANQLNPNNDAYWKSRGSSKPKQG